MTEHEPHKRSGSQHLKTQQRGDTMTTNFEGEVLDAIAERAFNMHNKFLNKIKEPRSVLPIDMNVSRGELLRTTYISLLKSAIEMIQEELDNQS